jgi:hypothetical protein
MSNSKVAITKHRTIENRIETKHQFKVTTYIRLDLNTWGGCNAIKTVKLLSCNFTPNQKIMFLFPGC